uniref:ARAD1D44242p n=1 Tax=Blastobotrys adeninivorans TaxID=409370 RepID=A0A060TD20_BLAAD
MFGKSPRRRSAPALERKKRTYRTSHRANSEPQIRIFTSKQRVRKSSVPLAPHLQHNYLSQLSRTTKQQGRPYSSEMVAKFVVADSIANCYEIANSKAPRGRKEAIISFMDLSKHRDFLRNGAVPSYVVENSGQGHDRQVYDCNDVGAAIYDVFGLREYTYVQVVRNTPDQCDEMKDKLKGHNVLKLMAVPTPIQKFNNTEFVKRDVAHPRYKAGMTLYIIPGASVSVKCYYSVKELLDQDVGEGSVPPDAEIYGPEALGVYQPNEGTSYAASGMQVRPERRARSNQYGSIPVATFLQHCSDVPPSNQHSSSPSQSPSFLPTSAPIHRNSATLSPPPALSLSPGSSRLLPSSGPSPSPRLLDTVRQEYASGSPTTYTTERLPPPPRLYDLASWNHPLARRILTYDPVRSADLENRIVNGADREVAIDEYAASVLMKFNNTEDFKPLPPRPSCGPELALPPISHLMPCQWYHR